jgi:hypothetical protein
MKGAALFVTAVEDDRTVGRRRLWTGEPGHETAGS